MHSLKLKEIPIVIDSICYRCESYLIIKFNNGQYTKILYRKTNPVLFYTFACNFLINHKLMNLYLWDIFLPLLLVEYSDTIIWKKEREIFDVVGNQVETGIKRALFLLLLASIITFPDIQYIFTNTFSRLYTDFFKDRVGKLRIYLSVQHNHIPSLCHDLRWLHSVKLHINVFISDATNKKEKNSVMTMIYCNYNAQFK